MCSIVEKGSDRRRDSDVFRKRAASRDLERVVLDDYPGDERLEDLHEALALYSPSDGSPYVDADGLRRAVQNALWHMAD